MRLRPLTDIVPKCLVPIRGRPLLSYWLELLFRGGTDRVLINTHHLAEQVREFISHTAWRDRVELVHEDQLLGTGGTVLRNAMFFEERSFIIAHADNLTCFDVGAFGARHASRPTGVEITMMTFDTDAPETCGIVEEDHRGVVVAFHEKVPDPPSRRANAAVYIFEPSVIDFLRRLDGPVIDLSTAVLPRYLGRTATFHNTMYHRDIGTPESLRRAEAEYPGCPAAERR
jgi:mannose-1-phosphate guanylyltransferase